MQLGSSFENERLVWIIIHLHYPVLTCAVLVIIFQLVAISAGTYKSTDGVAADVGTVMCPIVTLVNVCVKMDDKLMCIHVFLHSKVFSCYHYANI